MAQTYPIGTVARMTGLSIDTIRAWERRYGIVAPVRDEAGVRAYRPADVQRLELARAATGLGHPIRRVATLSNEQLRALIRERAGGRAQDGVGASIVQQILDAARTYDGDRAQQLLSSAALLLPDDEFVLNVLSPLLRCVGELWESGSFSVAQEHLISNLVRSLVGKLAHVRGGLFGKPMLFATPPQELHEFGIALAASLASLRGIRTCVLGPNVPAAEVVRAARFLQPETVVIGALLDERAAELRSYVRTLDAKLPAHVQVWLGGSDVVRTAVPRRSQRVQIVPTLAEFARRLPSAQP